MSSLDNTAHVDQASAHLTEVPADSSRVSPNIVNPELTTAKDSAAITGTNADHATSDVVASSANNGPHEHHTSLAHPHLAHDHLFPHYKNEALDEKLSAPMAYLAPPHAVDDHPERANVTNDQSSEKGAHATSDEVSLKGQLPDDNIFLTGYKLYLLMSSVLAVVALVAIDQSVLGAMIGPISKDFNNTDSIVWWTSAYLLTSAAFLPAFGKAYRYSLKWTFMFGLFAFLLGSVICAAAQDSNTLIGGRAVAGLGVAGLYIGAMSIVSVRIEFIKRAMWTGMIGAVFGISSALGPIVSAALSASGPSNWRYAFVINPPLILAAMLAIWFFLDEPPRESFRTKTRKQKLAAFDIPGTFFLLIALVLLLLAFQYGASGKYSWSSARVLGLLLGFAGCIAALIIAEYLAGDDAIFPLRYFKNRTIAAGFAYNMTMASAFFISILYLPVYFQVSGSSILSSGLKSLPFVGGLVFASALSGTLLPIVGWVPPFMFVGSILLTVGVGFFQTFGVHQQAARWVIVTFIAGAGTGVAWPLAFIAAQMVYKDTLDSERASYMTLVAQVAGASILSSVSPVLYQVKFRQNVEAIGAGLNVDEIVNSGATVFRTLTPPEYLPQVTAAAVSAVHTALFVAIPCAGVGVFFALFVEWKNMKGMQVKAVA